MKRSTVIMIILGSLLLCAGLWLALAQTDLRVVRRELESFSAHMSGKADQAFPELDTASLTPLQQRVVEISKLEYAKRPVSYDENVLKYSNGVVEPWCADYVSWVMREAGAPFKNPNSGGWRIPGVLTLRQYYQSIGKFKDAREYKPKTGDVAIFVNTSSFNTSKQHTSIVLEVNGDTMTTIGGNERGRLRVSDQQAVYGAKGLVGYGEL